MPSWLRIALALSATFAVIWMSWAYGRALRDGYEEKRRRGEDDDSAPPPMT